MFELSKYEWIAVVVTMTAVIVVNKLIVHDEGNTWLGLFAISFWTGLGLVHLRRWAQRRRLQTAPPR